MQLAYLENALLQTQLLKLQNTEIPTALEEKNAENLDFVKNPSVLLANKYSSLINDLTKEINSLNKKLNSAELLRIKKVQEIAEIIDRING